MEAILEAAKRDRFGKNEAGRIRREGRVPAVLYGGATREAVPLTVDPKSLLRILHSPAGLNTLITLKVDGAGDTRVLVKDYLVGPVSRQLLHADFYRVAMDKAIKVRVAIVLKGEAKGVKAQGGVVEFVNREIDIECLPGDIPEHLDVDVTELMVHDGIRVRDLAATATKWKALSDAETLIVHVVLPKVEVAPEPDAAAAATAAAPTAAAEPEVIKKGKVEKADDEKEKK
jgi:large subunit ribosomal protein L25